MEWISKYEQYINSLINNMPEGVIFYDKVKNNVLFFNSSTLNLLKIKSKKKDEISAVLVSKLSCIIEEYNKSNDDIFYESNICKDKSVSYKVRVFIFASVFNNVLIIKLSKDNYTNDNALENISFLFKKNPKIVTILNNLGNIEFVNNNFLLTFNFSANEKIIGSNILNFGSKYNEFQNIRIWKTLSEGQVWKGELKTAKCNGEELYLFASIFPVQIESKAEKFVIVAENITKEKQSEIKLAEAEKKKNIILNALPDTILVIDKKGLITQYKSETNNELFDKNNIIDKKISEINLPPDFSLKILEALKFTLKSKKIKQFNYDFNNNEKHYECRVVALNEEEVVCIIRDITKRMIAENMLKHREKSFKNMIENFPSGLLLQKGNKLLYANTTALKYLGCKSFNELKKYSILDLIPENLREASRDRINKALEGRNVPFIEIPVRKISNKKYYVYETKPVLFDYFGEKVCQIVMRDLSVQKNLIKEKLRAELAEKMNKDLQNEMQIRKNVELSLNNSLKEKEELIKEIHHRVKNNMQVMTSILNLQSNMIEDKSVKQIFEESQNRIKSMALVHENIYSNKSLTKMDFKQYLVSLTDNLLRSYELNEKNIEIKLKINNFYLPVTLAVPCGLIINELISSSIKRFFVEISNKCIIFVEAKLNNNEVQILISDNGEAIKDKKILTNPKSLGFQLVTALVDQLNGSITLESLKHNKFSIFFNI